MRQADRESEQKGETSPEEGLPEAFRNNTPENAPRLKEIYKNEPASKRKTSTGVNVADEGSKESFPASDPPASMPTSDPSFEGGA